MTIVITGSSGYVAHNFLNIYKNDEIVKVSLRIKSKLFFRENRNLNNILKNSKTKINKLILFGWGELHDYNSEKHINEIFKKNKDFVNYMINNFSIEEIIGVGTCLEYGRVEGKITENTKCKPTTNYGRGKLKFYKYLNNVCNKNHIRYKWARLFYNYGYNQKKNTLLKQLSVALENKEKIFHMSAGNQKRDYLPIKRVVYGLKQLILSQNFRGSVNISSGESISINKLVSLYLSKKKQSIKIVNGSLRMPEYEAFNFWGSDDLYLKEIDKEKLLKSYF